MTRYPIVLALALLVGCAKREPPPGPPPPTGSEGAICSAKLPCNPGLECLPTSIRCAKPDHPELVAARAAAAAAAEAERRYLEQSGVQPSPEQPAPAPGPPAGGAVRVVTISTGGTATWAFAACRADERLVGGGCRLNTALVTTIDSYPSGHSATDTLGARWNCGRKSAGTLDLEAYALCQRP